jgi:hypothetical protein
MRILYFTKTLLKLIRSGITAKRPAQTFEMVLADICLKLTLYQVIIKIEDNLHKHIDYDYRKRYRGGKT